MAIETLRPDSTGDRSENTPTGDSPNYACVDEVTSDGDSTYVGRVGVTAAYDLYNIPDHSLGTGTINHVKLYGVIKTYYGAYLHIKTHDTEYDGSQIVGSSGPSWTLYSHTWTDNPNSSGAWTWNEVDALQIGLKLLKNNLVNSYCTQEYVEIDYTPTEKNNTIFFGTNF